MASHKNGLLSVSRKMVALLMITRCKIYRAGFIHWIRVGWSPSELARATDSSSQPQQLNFSCTITNIKPMPSEMVVALCLKVNTLHSLCIHYEQIPLSQNIATGETSQAITPHHFFHYSNFFGFYH